MGVAWDVVDFFIHKGWDGSWRVGDKDEDNDKDWGVDKKLGLVLGRGFDKFILLAVETYGQNWFSFWGIPFLLVK